jgi:protein gp37
MGERTGIAWCDSTRNFWSGCTKVGPGCDGCYAEAFNRWTRGKNTETGEAKNWGPGAPRVSHINGAVRDLKRWNKEAEAAGKSRTVFVNTFADTFDNEVDDDWRNVIWLTIDNCPWIDFLLVTKRIGNVAKMAPAGWMSKGFPPNVRILITVVNQEEAERDIPKLLSLPCRNGVSYEPAVGPVDWAPWLSKCAVYPEAERQHWHGVRALQWLIVGGESKQTGHRPRPFDIAWARDTVSQCKTSGVAVFVKQLGSNAQEIAYPAHVSESEKRRWMDDGWTHIVEGAKSHWRKYYQLKDADGEDPTEWPEDLRVREFPAALVPA